jgi:hypothetical protein
MQTPTSISRLVIYTDTSSNTYLMESSLGQRMFDLLMSDSEVPDVDISPSVDAGDLKKFNMWAPSNKTEDWLRTIGVNLYTKIVPLEKQDAIRPPSFALTRAAYTMAREYLETHGLHVGLDSKSFSHSLRDEKITATAIPQAFQEEEIDLD